MYGSTFPPCPRFPSLFWEESTKTAAPHCTHFFFFFSFPLNLQFISHRARLLTQSDVAAEVEPNNPPPFFVLPSFHPSLSLSRSHWPCFSRALDVWIHCAFLSPSAPLCQIGPVYHVCTRPRRRPHGNWQAQLARPSTNCFQAGDTSHSININTSN